MRIDCLTLFPEMFNPFISSSIIGRGIEKGLFEIHIHDFREYSLNRHKKVDDTVYGGGAGMLISVEPIVRCLKSIEGYEDAYVILTAPTGTTLNQGVAKRLKEINHLIIICGHYEGIDARILEYVDEVVSIGDFVLTGGEIASMAIIDSTVRLISGVISDDSTVDESFNNCLLEYDQYTKPYDYEGLKVPDILLSGKHEEIRKWRLRNSIEKTYLLRPDLIKEENLTKEELKIFNEIKNRTK